MGQSVKKIDIFSCFEVIGFTNQWSITTSHESIYTKFGGLIELSGLYHLASRSSKSDIPFKVKDSYKWS